MGKITYQDIEKWESKRDVKKLVKALNTDDFMICDPAAKALVRIGDPSTVEDLVRRVEASSFRFTSIPAMIVGIGQVSGPKHIPLFVSLLSSNIFDVPAAAAKVLDQMGDATVEPLIATLASPNLGARQLAASLLGNRRDNRAVAPLMAALDDDDGNMRISVAAALGRIGDPSAIPALEVELEKERPNDYAARHIKNVIAMLEKGEVVPVPEQGGTVKVTIRVTGLIHDSDRHAGDYQADLPLDQAAPHLLNSIAKSIIWKDQVRFYTGYQLICPNGTLRSREAGPPSTLREAGVRTGDTLEFVDWGGEFI